MGANSLSLSQGRTSLVHTGGCGVSCAISGLGGRERTLASDGEGGGKRLLNGLGESLTGTSSSRTTAVMGLGSKVSIASVISAGAISGEATGNLSPCRESFRRVTGSLSSNCSLKAIAVGK